MAEASPLSVRRCRPMLGTFVEIAAPAGAERAVDAAFAAVAHVQARMSFHDEASDLAALRRAPAGEGVKVDRETMTVLRAAAALHVESEGLFDVAIGARLVASGFLPRPPGVDPARMTGDAGDIEILDDTHVRCRRPLLIDLGGIAKGHAVDRAVDALRAAGVGEAVVNAGGDLRVLGVTPRAVWLREADGTLGPALMLADAALASSANLLGRRRRGGRVAVPHIGRGGVAASVDHAVSVVAPRCIQADALTKVALAEPARAAAMLARRGGAIVARAPVAVAA